MLATTAAVRKAIENDGRCRLLCSRRNGFLSSLGNRKTNIDGVVIEPGSTNDAIFTVLRCYSSHSAWPRTAAHCYSSTNDDDGKSSSERRPHSAAASSFSLRAENREYRNTSYWKYRNEKGLSFQSSTPMRSFRSPRNGPGAIGQWESRTRLYPHCEGRVFLSTSLPPETPTTKSNNATQAKIPIPKSSPTLSTSSNPFASINFGAIVKTSLEMTWYITKTLCGFVIHLPGNIIFFATHSKERREKIAGMKETIKKEVDHYWVGIKLLMADVKTARNLLKKTLQGSTLTRRERKQLLRTVSDLFRLVPMSMFLVIPFMEFALPFALKIFPNMLPSTFQDSLKSEENMKRELKSRIAMAEFFQETMEELAHEQKRIAANRQDGKDEPADSIASKQEASASDMLKFLDLARQGEIVPPDAIIQYANYFQDDLTLDNMPRMQLINMCKYMSIHPYGSDSFLRFQLRHIIRMLKEDDQRILWEGIDSLTKMELREACQDRGMRSMGLSKEAYKRSLQQWLDLSVNKNVPISLLIMSRTFFLQEEIISPAKAAASDESQSVTGLADAISGMDKEVLNEVILQVATSEEFKSDPDVRKIQLEVVTHQNEKIKEEQAERDAKKKKNSSEKEEPQAAATEISPKDTTEAEKLDSDEAGKVTKEEILDAIDVKVEELKGDLVEKAAEVEMGERELSPEEMESISQLLSADPVVKEREHLARIKQAMREESESEKEDEVSEKASTSTSQIESTIEIDDSDKEASATIKQMKKESADEAEKFTSFSKESELDYADNPSLKDSADVVDTSSPEEIVIDDPEDPVVAKLKKRIESMVDKIELQLSDVQVKIGDKLHYLDKDMDGILSRVEMADVLSQVLKKDLSFEEALEIADAMDENKDGVFTVQELIKWIETNQLVKFESEGRDAEMDKIMESKSNEKEDANRE
mmetsp:Transcript_50953/g.104837  ORF Transcript_50953/g.104837 Transcript_50953/m.104837 type:complete len:933 (-) Transcript_50953:415-3213(-)|eukprot:CAMPEP_0201214784 /NCGR_PEP_ID=MMETSP0851-20130426/188592_1 /ASSEMBLY_ACC=CAM_ASM_000631 /TAXON_ID=183588 /ORGANISM="Pseudo-nitzschia fraudulenta, Strain WWA7" /LENGTH=932 /DNA_ID=CAMNT_0047504157 /DNA_START=153 /DNA_END=2951 /DNA_ORIENTATION=+